MNVAVIALLLPVLSAAQDLTVYIEPGEIAPAVYLRARQQVTSIFANAGIHIRWTESRPTASTGQAVVRITVESRTPRDVRPGALAYAYPFDRVGSIVVMYDRVRAAVARAPRLEAPLLAHVLAHELGHVLQGTTYHASAGVMKAHWRPEDFAQMAQGSLSFTRLDIDMLRDGLSAMQSAAGVN